MKKQLHAAPGFEDGGYHRYTQETTQGGKVEAVAALFKFVEHVQGTYHRQVHVDELGGEVEIAFEIARIKHVDDDVRRFLYDLSPHVELFRTVGRERVGAGQVYQPELISLEPCSPFFSVYGDAGVVAHPFVRPRGEVEERSLAAVGIPH